MTHGTSCGIPKWDPVTRTRHPPGATIDSEHTSLAALDPSGRVYNEDLAPATGRKWSTYSFFAVWMSAIHNIGTYTFVAGLFVIGLTGWEVLAAILLGTGILFFGMNWAGRMGQRTGVPEAELESAE
ncbi:cytosine permease [Arthrobacter celericrescens]|uniref:cytosine permease n=1 Tax=Arthrobacter celericrescens TaxID=2320851 RepID=UPI001968C527|nr:cytosine permease [Arthrobacter celericrescens]